MMSHRYSQIGYVRAPLYEIVERPKESWAVVQRRGSSCACHALAVRGRMSIGGFVEVRLAVDSVGVIVVCSGAYR